MLLPCDACGIGKSTRATFHGKVMTEVTVGSVWQTDISGKWATPSLQGNVYTIGDLECSSRKIFVYFSKTKEVYYQTKDLLDSACAMECETSSFIVM